MSISVASNKKDDDAIEYREIAHNPKHRLLLRTDHMRGADKFRCFAEFGMNARSRHLRGCFTTPDEGACLSVHSRAGFNGQRLTGKHRLIEED